MFQNVIVIMKIICKRGEKDYYDYLQNTYGIDELVVYDRRKSFPIDLSNFYIGNGLDLLFKKEKDFNDTKRKLVRGCWGKSAMEGRIFYFILEIGYYHYYFKVERYIDDNGKLILEPSLSEKKKIEKNKRLSNTPISICTSCSVWCGDVRIDREKKVVENPILKNTYIPKFIEAKEIWNNVYEYLSSLRDKEIVDGRTNDEHIESHGFDKKISFRHRK